MKVAFRPRPKQTVLAGGNTFTPLTLLLDVVE